MPPPDDFGELTIGARAIKNYGANAVHDVVCAGRIYRQLDPIAPQLSRTG